MLVCWQRLLASRHCVWVLSGEDPPKPLCWPTVSVSPSVAGHGTNTFEGSKRQGRGGGGFVTPTDSNAHGDASLLHGPDMGKTQNYGTVLGMFGGWRLVAVDGWRLAAPGDCSEGLSLTKKIGVLKYSAGAARAPQVQAPPSYAGHRAECLTVTPKLKCFES